jgi:hypothetical protein
LKEIFQSIVDGKYSVFITILGCIPVVGDLIALLVSFGISWINSNIVPSMQPLISANMLSSNNNTIEMTSNLLLQDRSFKAVQK